MSSIDKHFGNLENIKISLGLTDGETLLTGKDRKYGKQIWRRSHQNYREEGKYLVLQRTAVPSFIAISIRPSVPRVLLEMTWRGEGWQRQSCGGEPIYNLAK